MKHLQLRPAELRDLSELVRISREAFDTDVTVGGKEPGGPPDYDSAEWHRRMAEEGHLYTACQGEAVIGGAVLFRDENEAAVLYIGRIFIDPAHFGKGFGIELMERIEELSPAVSEWRLDTPVWNLRTNRFYPKLGYRETGRDHEAVYYRKKMER